MNNFENVTFWLWSNEIYLATVARMMMVAQINHLRHPKKHLSRTIEKRTGLTGWPNTSEIAA